MHGYVYEFLDKDNEIIYVGKTKNFELRMAQHFSYNGHLPKECYESVRNIRYAKLDTYADASLFEMYFIIRHNPKYNSEFIVEDDLTFVMSFPGEWNTIPVNEIKNPSFDDNTDKYIRIYKGTELLYQIPYMRNIYDVVKNELHLTSKFDEIQIGKRNNEKTIYRISCMHKNYANRFLGTQKLQKPSYDFMDLV